MRVLFLDQFSHLGGAQQVLSATLAAARQGGWETWAALPTGGPLINQLRSCGVPLLEIPCGPYRSGNKRVRDLVRFAADLTRQASLITDLIHRVEFDLLYVNGPRLLPAAARAARRQVPVLFHAHNHVEQTLARTLAAWSIRRTDASVVACSSSVLAEYRDYCAPSKQFVIPNGVTDMGFRERSFARDGNFRVGIIGRISPEKGQVEFVGAAGLLHAEFPAARFVICGAPLFAGSSYFHSVQDLARNLPVDFLGWRDDIATVLGELDLLIVPSKQEGMGRVVVEAFSAGVPVVAFAVGGIPEVVTDGETGFLIRETTAEALADRLCHLFRGDPARLRRIAVNARRVWEQNYTLEAYCIRITQLIQQVAESRAAGETKSPPRRK